ncbi:MAG: hypothetical protein JXB04_07250 [Kiritimatiellae bacterium]|nr:hypothetical protein [Kiritimatiellia bacterium]
MKPISYTAPLATAWQRMKVTLFAPLDIMRWLVLGFAAWLASLNEGAGPLVQIPRTCRSSGADERMAERVSSFVDARLFVAVAIGAVVVLLAAALALVLIWINSRAKLVFLDNVIRNRAEIAAPWKRLKPRGDSLFLWRLGFALVCAVLIVAVVVLSLILALPFAARDELRPLSLVGAVVAGSLAFSVALAAAYIRLFLEDFVIPLMHKLNLGAVRAWGHFMVLLRAHFMAFILYGLFRFALALVVSAAIVAVFLSTCFLCCAGILLFVPYVGTVLILPIAVFFRVYGPAFLAQFGTEYDCLGEAPAAAPVAKFHRFEG